MSRTQTQKKAEEVQRNINVLSSAVLSNRQLVEKLHLAEAVLNEDLEDGQESSYGGSSSEGDDERRAQRKFQADYTAAMSPPPSTQASRPPDPSTQLMRTYDGVQPIGSPSADIYASLPPAVVQSRTGNTPRPAAPTSGPFGQPPPLIDLSIPTSEDGSYSRTAKQEVRALLGEWTSTPSSVMSQYLGKVPMMKEQPSRPEASSNTTQQGRSNQTQPANRSTEDTSLAKPYATIEAWSSHKAEQQSLIACLADRGGGYVWRHEDEANHWYYVGERLVVQYRLYKSDADKASSNPQALKTVISKQWIYKDTLTKSGYHFAEYGEGNYAIAGLLTPVSPKNTQLEDIVANVNRQQTVHALHTSASRWKEELMEKRAKQALSKPERQMVKARYSFRAPKPTDLPFEIADIFDADVDKNQQWWKAYKNGTSGDIPANYVEVVVDVRETERQLVQATRNHESSSSTHLNFTRDDIFEADTFRETEWWRGHIQDGSGLFQAKYVEVIGPA